MRTIAVISMCAFALATSAMVTAANAKVSRDAAVKRCVANAQEQVPSRMGDTDNVQNQRFALYRSCMKSAGYNP